MGRQIRDASDCVALHFDVWRIHLLDQWGQTTQCDNGNLVLGCGVSVMRQGSTHAKRTVDGKIPQRCARGTLHFYVRILEQEQNRLQCVAVDFSDIYEGAY